VRNLKLAGIVRRYCCTE
jgi:hypothetical protein